MDRVPRWDPDYRARKVKREPEEPFAAAPTADGRGPRAEGISAVTLRSLPFTLPIDSALRGGGLISEQTDAAGGNGGHGFTASFREWLRAVAAGEVDMSVNDSGIEPESPHIKRLDPDSGPSTGGGTLYVYGLHFQNLLDVSFGKDNKADPAQVSVTPDGTLITVNSVPPAPIAANDQLIVGVTVRTQPAGSSGPLTSNAVNYTYKQA